MKKLTGAIVTLALLLVSGCSSGDKDPLQFEAFTIATGEEITGLDFISNSDGCAVTASGNILRTSDGGKSFLAVGNSGGKRLEDIYFLDDEIGLVCGEKGALLRSIDGGATWTTLTADSAWDLVSIGFPDDEVGLIVGNYNMGEFAGMGVIGRSTDKGLIWNFAKTEYAELHYIDVVPHEHAWVLGREALVYTTDGGQVWEHAASRIPGINALLFMDIQRGWEVGDNGLLRYSSDGGWSWQDKLKMTDESLTCLAIPEPDIVYIAGNSFLAVSVNHGRNWVMDTVSHKFRFVDIDAVDHFVFAAGSGGQLIKLKY